MVQEAEQAGPVGRSGRDRAVPGAAAAGAGIEMTLGLAALARHIIRAVAPEQVELVERIPARWTVEEAPGSKRWGWVGGTVASGMVPAVLGEIVFPLLTGVFTQVLGTSALHGWQQRRWLRRRPAEPPVAQVHLYLDTDQITRLRSTCAAYARTLGLGNPEADLLAAALADTLQQALDEGRSDRTAAADQAAAVRRPMPERLDTTAPAIQPPSLLGTVAAPTELPPPRPTSAPAPPTAGPLDSAEAVDRNPPPAS